MHKENLNKEQAKAIEEALKDYDADTLIDICANEDHSQWNPVCEPLASMRIATIARAVYVGYKVIVTPEEQIKMLYDQAENNILSYDDSDANKDWWLGYKQGLKEALCNLNIYIDGVNKGDLKRRGNEMG